MGMFRYIKNEEKHFQKSIYSFFVYLIPLQVTSQATFK